MFRGKLVAQWGVAAEFRLYGQRGRGGGREAGTWPGSQAVWSMTIKCPNTLCGESFFFFAWGIIKLCILLLTLCSA